MVKNILYSNIDKEKKQHYQNAQEFWEMIKNLPNRRRIRDKGIENLLTEIITEKFTILEKVDTQTQDEFRASNRYNKNISERHCRRDKRNSMETVLKRQRNSIKSYKEKTTQLLREANVGEAGWGGGWGSPEVGMGFSGAGIVGHYEPPDMGAGDRSRSFAGRVYILTC